MNRVHCATVRLLAVLGLMVVSSTASAAAPGTTPLLDAAGDQWFGPAWVPAATAFQPDGAPRVEVLGETGARALVFAAIRREQLEREGGQLLDPAVITADNTVHDIECSVVTLVPRPEFETRPHATLDEISRNAAELMIGTVVATEQGFSLGRAGWLLTVDVARVLASESPDLGAVLVFYPDASFTVGGLPFCSRGWFEEHTPSTGDRVLVARFRPWDAAGARMIHARWWELPVVLTAEGGVVVARPLAVDPSPASGPELEAAIAAAVAGR